MTGAARGPCGRRSGRAGHGLSRAEGAILPRPTMSESAHLVSVIIPNWNGARFLRPCLDSLRAQTYRPVEIIVADGASSDGSQELIRAEYPEVQLLVLD